MRSLIFNLVIFGLLVLIGCQDAKNTSREEVVVTNTDVKEGFPIQYPPKIPPQPTDDKVPKGKPIKQPFDPKDKGINLNVNTNICQSLKHFAIRFGTNGDAPQKYLTSPAACAKGSLNILPATGPSNRPGDNQLFYAYQLTDKTWVLESKTCAFYFIRALSPTTIKLSSGPYFSSKFWIQYHDNHIHIKSNFYGSYWAGGLPLQLSEGATYYMVEFWPQFKWP